VSVNDTKRRSERRTDKDVDLGRVAVVILDVHSGPFQREAKIFDLQSKAVSESFYGARTLTNHPRSLDLGPLAEVGNDDDVAETTKPQRELSSSFPAPPRPIASSNEENDGRESSIRGGSISDGEVDVESSSTLGVQDVLLDDEVTVLATENEDSAELEIEKEGDGAGGDEVAKDGEGRESHLVDTVRRVGEEREVARQRVIGRRVLLRQREVQKPARRVDCERRVSWSSVGAREARCSQRKAVADRSVGSAKNPTTGTCRRIVVSSLARVDAS
jgi:hypothetical protein